MANKPNDIPALIDEHGVRIVDFRFTDLAGTWQRASLPVGALDDAAVRAGIAFDAAAIRGCRPTEGSDVVLKPDLSTARLETFRSVPTLSLICDVLDPTTNAPCENDPRAVARRAAEYLTATGIADTASFGFEAAFVLFERTANRHAQNAAGLALEPLQPSDRFTEIRDATALELERRGIAIALQRHDDAGRIRIDVRADALLSTADHVMRFKDVVKSVAARNGSVATFMPKPLVDDDGSGLHARQSLWKDGKPLFFDAGGYAECSQPMLFYIGGILTHIDSVLAFAAPTTNSYKRLAAHGRAPVRVAFSRHTASAAIRIPTLAAGDAKAQHLEFRPSDATANPYLALSAMVLAGIDGIKNKIDPIKAGFGPLDRDVDDRPSSDVAQPRTVPHSLRASLDALAADHAYLLEGGVFSEGLIETWIGFKREHDVAPIEARPHPYEFALSFDA